MRYKEFHFQHFVHKQISHDPPAAVANELLMWLISPQLIKVVVLMALLLDLMSSQEKWKWVGYGNGVQLCIWDSGSYSIALFSSATVQH